MTEDELRASVDALKIVAATIFKCELDKEAEQEFLSGSN